MAWLQGGEWKARLWGRGPCRAGGPDRLALLALVLRGSRDESCQKREQESPKVSRILLILLVLYPYCLWVTLPPFSVSTGSPPVPPPHPGPSSAASPCARGTSCRSSFGSYSLFLQDAQMSTSSLESHTPSRLWDIAPSNSGSTTKCLKSHAASSLEPGASDPERPALLLKTRSFLLSLLYPDSYQKKPFCGIDGFQGPCLGMIIFLSSYYLPAQELGISQADTLPAPRPQAPTGAAFPMDAETGLCCSWEVT